MNKWLFALGVSGLLISQAHSEPPPAPKSEALSHYPLVKSFGVQTHFVVAAPASKFRQVALAISGVVEHDTTFKRVLLEEDYSVPNQILALPSLAGELTNERLDKLNLNESERRQLKALPSSARPTQFGVILRERARAFANKADAGEYVLKGGKTIKPGEELNTLMTQQKFLSDPSQSGKPVQTLFYAQIRPAQRRPAISLACVEIYEPEKGKIICLTREFYASHSYNVVLCLSEIMAVTEPSDLFEIRQGRWLTTELVDNFAPSISRSIGAGRLQDELLRDYRAVQNGKF
ncbi:MAG: hypothetical protein SGI71_02865 [Verrucomicrobiota bacterium]|nr:hypothetical protein [Verrucomicrobiota bacterium]